MYSNRQVGGDAVGESGSYEGCTATDTLVGMLSVSHVAMRGVQPERHRPVGWDADVQTVSPVDGKGAALVHCKLCLNQPHHVC